MSSSRGARCRAKMFSNLGDVDPREVDERQTTSQLPSSKASASAVCAACVLSCGLQGFHCATGGAEPTCHVKCCGAKCDNAGAVLLACALSVCCCGGVWPAYATRVHRSCGAPYWNPAWSGAAAVRGGRMSRGATVYAQ